jgi:hypothetical protein
MEEEAIRTLVTRLSRQHPSGGTVVERAAILAAGADFDAVIAWILDHHGSPETVAAPAPKGGLYGARVSPTSGADTPRRFVLPAGALT